MAARVGEISSAVDEIAVESERAQRGRRAASAQTLSATADQPNGLVRRFKLVA